MFRFLFVVDWMKFWLQKKWFYSVREFTVKKIIVGDRFFYICVSYVVFVLFNTPIIIIITFDIVILLKT